MSSETFDATVEAPFVRSLVDTAAAMTGDGEAVASRCGRRALTTAVCKLLCKKIQVYLGDLGLALSQRLEGSLKELAALGAPLTAGTRKGIFRDLKDRVSSNLTDLQEGIYPLRLDDPKNAR
jgi:hypothetical protein